MFLHRWLLILTATVAFYATQAQQLTVTLTGSMHNGSSIPCFGKKVGSIATTVTGGTAPYWYTWSNGETTAEITGVSAGFYSVDVKDADGTVEKAVITLTEPEELKVTATVSSFANGHNISCFECNNGYIQVSATQGTPPYSYSWSDGPSSAQNRYTLGPKAYKVTVTDANGCESSTSVNITQPERSDWTMNGNAGTNPATQYIGTSDNKDVVFKANGQEGLRLKANGGISLLGDLVGTGPVVRDSDGSLRLGGDENLPAIGANECYTRSHMPYWNSTGNSFGGICPDVDPLLGTLVERPLKMVTSGVERMRITVDGKVGIGVTTPLMALHVQGGMLFHTPHGSIISSNDENDGMALWTRNNLASWGLSIDPSGTGHILGDINDPHPALSFTYDRVTVANRLVVGDVDAPNGYRLFVQEGILTEKVKVAVRTSNDWSDHVFQPGYRLMPLKDVATFIKEHGHLPGVPSADQMVESGLDVVRTDAMLLEKIEEITLHLIGMEKRVSDLEAENATLKIALGR